jgi:alpha-L-fucosidase
VTISRREFNYGLMTAATLLGGAHRLDALSSPTQMREPLLDLQQKFLDLRFGMFIHLNMATFEEREWGDPKASPKLFNPARLDTDQWAEAAASANMGYGCLTTKHHDGFCLWPTKTSSPSVKDSSFPHDIVRSYTDSFRKRGLKVCLYLSILDLRADIRPYQITSQKIDLIKTQLTELLTNYGEITMLIFDGWDCGWARLHYDQLPFRTIYDHIKSLQPNCLVSDHNAGQYPGPALYYSDIKEYEQHAGQKIPADSLVPSQSGNTLQSEWFWKSDYPKQELTPAKQIVEEWLIPFNQGHCNLILNVAPNRDGRFDPNAIARLEEIGKLWKNPGPSPKIAASIQITTPNLAFAKRSFASSSADTSGPDLANDNNFRSSWMCDEGQTSGWLEIDFDQSVAFNTVSIVESRYDSDSGAKSRIDSYRVQRWHDGSWSDLAIGKGGNTFQLHQFQRISAERIRLVLSGSTLPPGITEFGVYNEPVGS